MNFFSNLVACINVELKAAVSYFGKNEPDATEIRMKGYSST